MDIFVLNGLDLLAIVGISVIIGYKFDWIDNKLTQFAQWIKKAL